jgi:hypothetical protein
MLLPQVSTDAWFITSNLNPSLISNDFLLVFLLASTSNVDMQTMANHIILNIQLIPKSMNLTERIDLIQMICPHALPRTCILQHSCNVVHLPRAAK